MTTRPDTRRSRAAIATVLGAALAGCQTPRYFEDAPALRGPVEPASTPSRETPRALPMFAGGDGAPLGWTDLMDAVTWADVVIIGEIHDDAVGHAVQRAVVEDAVRRWPRAVLSMEMLERDEQPLVDDYFDGIIDAETFAKLTFSKNWGGEGMWSEWYQPIVDAAKNGGGRVVAANAPRRYVRLARTGGYERLAAVPAGRRRWFEYPARPPEGEYRDRFYGLMAVAHAPPADDDTESPEEPPADDDAESAEEPLADDDTESPEEPAAEVVEPPPLDEQAIEAMFRSQLVWDTTMAASIARARFRGAPKVVHLVGQFHSDFEGGTLVELRKRMPGARILVLSMQQAWPDGLRAEDLGRADVIVYTGERPVEEEAEEEEEEEEEEQPDDEEGDDAGVKPQDAAPPAQDAKGSIPRTPTTPTPRGSADREQPSTPRSTAGAPR